LIEKPKKYCLTLPKLFDTILKLDKYQQEKVLKYAEDLLYEDKRIAVRKRCNIQINYASQNRIDKDYITNISQSGLFIKTNNPLGISDDIYMSFKMKGYDRPFKVKGIIVYRNRKGVGIEFKDFRPYIEQMLGSLINRLKNGV
jgi:Tfp pilus assembly protein PilZ